MADKKFKLEAVPDNPPDLAPAIAKKINEAGVAEGTKKKLLTMMGKPDTEAKLLKETAAKDAADDLKKFKEKVVDKAPELVAIEDIRKDIHDKIIGVALAGEFKSGADTYKFEDLDKAKAAFKKPEAPAPAPTPAPTPNTPSNPEVEESVPTADSSVYTLRQAAGVGVLGAGALAAGTAVGGISGMATGSSTIPLWTRFGTGAMNFLNGTRDVLWQKTGLSYLWHNGVTGPLTSLASKLGISTGATANTAALAGLPSWMGTAATGGLVLGGAYAGSKLLNWAGHKVGVEPTTIPFLGKIPILGPILNSFVTVPPKMAWKGVSTVAGWGGKTFGWMWKQTKEAAAKRNEVARFGIGGLIGGGIVAGLTGGSSLLWSLIGGEAARRGLKGKSWTDFIPAPFGIKKSAGGGGGH